VNRTIHIQGAPWEKGVKGFRAVPVVVAALLISIGSGLKPWVRFFGSS
jgi:hypothetical protein